MRQKLHELRDAGHLAGWAAPIYEPEEHAFGGPEAMDIAHHLFHRDSHHILDHIGSNRHTDRQDGRRRELSILLCSALMRTAGQDWYEQGDIWARVAHNRPAPADPLIPRRQGLATDLQRLITVDVGPAGPAANEAFANQSGWLAAFHRAGQQLRDLAHHGILSRGLRAVLTHHVIFHWNRIGLSYLTQGILARTARTVILGDDVLAP